MADTAASIIDSGPTLIIVGEVVNVGQQLTELLDELNLSASAIATGIQSEALYA
jgi:uroporphyrin-III C-methyltransferase